ncbi:hypothetical protein SP37_13 [Salmonella phage 37]|uniref:Uncharacterized protein n=1 Tax=Salmonella phage 37 TaxID=1654890 RepID=A0A0N7C9U4_9CAUD|nr:hypothetical protein SP37_13 [Salmonella phage 37]AKJ73880.1 hypothetical protein SP37_13 [Salmonella phage 37]
MAEPIIRESKVEKRCCEYAQGRGWWVSKFTAPGKKAVPDRVLIRGGIVLLSNSNARRRTNGAAVSPP